MSQVNTCPGLRVTPSTSQIYKQPHVDLEAIVALYCILRDVSAGAQVNLPIQLVCLKQEDPPWAPLYRPPTTGPSPFQDPPTQAPHLLGGGVSIIFEA